MSALIYICYPYRWLSFPSNIGLYPNFCGKSFTWWSHSNTRWRYRKKYFHTKQPILRIDCAVLDLENSYANIVGLVHYRRYFADLNHPEMNIIHMGKPILDTDRLSDLISSEKRIILPKPKSFGKRRFFKLFKKQKTVYQQYSECHFKKTGWNWKKLSIGFSLNIFHH